MKEYPVTASELWTLGGIQIGSGASLGFAGWLAGFYVNSAQGIAFADKQTSPEVLGQWQAYSNMAFWGMIAAAVLGLFLLALVGLNVRRLIKDTTHGTR